jgi:hypothetical protein
MILAVGHSNGTPTRTDCARSYVLSCLPGSVSTNCFLGEVTIYDLTAGTMPMDRFRAFEDPSVVKLAFESRGPEPTKRRDVRPDSLSHGLHDVFSESRFLWPAPLLVGHIGRQCFVDTHDVCFPASRIENSEGVLRENVGRHPRPRKRESELCHSERQVVRYGLCVSTTDE